MISGVSNLLGNAPLEQAMFECWQRLGPPPFDEADRAFARKIQGTLSDEDIANVDESLALEGRIERDDWVGQAQALVAELAAAEVAAEDKPEGPSKAAG